jgi:hypothetical protein
VPRHDLSDLPRVVGAAVVDDQDLAAVVGLEPAHVVADL